MLPEALGPMIFVDGRFCKGCGICVHLCSKHALELSKEVNSRGFYTPQLTKVDECTECRQCELYCPDFAIFVKNKEADDKKAGERKEGDSEDG
jgi:2-oxoglutarate ferredoxin oxidoreductase subunit delta